jgi:hypothetical protein
MNDEEKIKVRTHFRFVTGCRSLLVRSACIYLGGRIDLSFGWVYVPAGALQLFRERVDENRLSANCGPCQELIERNLMVAAF